MASVNTVYNTLKDLANKEQKGFVTPSVFNNFAQIAQVNVFKGMLDKIVASKRLRLRQADGSRHMSVENQIKEDLSSLSKTTALSKSNGVFTKPDDFAYLISMTSGGTILLGQSTRVNVEVLYDESKIDYILKSDLSAPSESHPIGLISDDIEVFPSSISRLRLTYYKYPEGLSPTTGARTASLPSFGYTTSNGVHVYEASTSVDFELPDHYVPELVTQIAMLIGINLRDQDVFTYASQEDIKNKQ
jgi:hypothetical protein